MKKTFLLFCFYSFFINLLFATDNDIITLDLSNPTHPAEFILNKEKGYWKETYNNAEEFRWINFDLFSLTHIPTGFGGSDVGEGMSYWDGFTYCASGDTFDYGITGSSDGWLARQWGCMAGGGIKTDKEGKVLTDANGKVIVEKGIPYLVAYWGYWVEMNQGGDPCLQVKFTDGKPYIPKGIYLCNHPWPYYGNIHGDGFASAFTQEGDYFKVTIHGMNEEGEDMGVKVDHILAEFKNGKLEQSTDWQWVDLSALGTVYGIYFTMESTDMHNIIELGPNTAVYFCMDKLQVRPAEESAAPSRPTGLKTIPTETSIQFLWNASTGNEEIKGYNLYIDGNFHIFTQNTTYHFTGLFPYIEYQIGIEAVAMDGTLSEKVFINSKTIDETPPTPPQNLTGTTTKYTMTLIWNASTDNVEVTEYHIYLNGERQKRVYATTYTLEGLDPQTSYKVEVEARDEAGNRSEKATITLITRKEDTGLENTDKKLFLAYPNPAKDYIYIQTIWEESVDIYDLQGIKVRSVNLPIGLNKIDITLLPKGKYILIHNNLTEFIIK